MGVCRNNYSEVPRVVPDALRRSVAARMVKAHRRALRRVLRERAWISLVHLSTLHRLCTRKRGGNTPNFVGHFASAINKGERLRLPGGGGPRRDVLHVDDLTERVFGVLRVDHSPRPLQSRRRPRRTGALAARTCHPYGRGLRPASCHR